MNISVKKSIIIVKRKGTVESLIYLTKILITRLYSYLKIFYLKIRGYGISKSVILKGNNFFFQSVKKSIVINQGAIIGQHTRISAGEEGKVSIGKNVLIDNFTYIMSHSKIEIGDNTKIASFCFIIDFNHRFSSKTKNIIDQGYEGKPIKIGKNVWIGAHVVILPGVTIGDRSVIGAGSIVTKNIPESSVAVGNPAKIIKNR